MVFEESVILTGPFDHALTQVKDALKAEGFGVLTQIDMQSVFSEKLGKDIGSYVILGVCNPTIADRALDIEPQIGVLLPCNVVVRAAAAGTVVEALDPGVMTTLIGNEELQTVVDDARARLGSALNRMTLEAA